MATDHQGFAEKFGGPGQIFNSGPSFFPKYVGVKKIFQTFSKKFFRADTSKIKVQNSFSRQTPVKSRVKRIFSDQCSKIKV
jgi:hypothetical protein